MDLANIDRERRQHSREPQTEETSFSIACFSGPGKFFTPPVKGTIVDVSTEGIGLLTDTPLRPGNLLKFTHVPHPHIGIVMWSVHAQDRFRVGLRFLSHNK